MFPEDSRRFHIGLELHGPSKIYGDAVTADMQEAHRKAVRLAVPGLTDL
jgi:hypothetical protein